jgi:C-terminal processing protease CtpA/Prc
MTKMKRKAHQMKKLLRIVLIPALLITATTLVAGGEATQSPSEELERVEYQSMRQEAERARQEAEVAHQGAIKAAEMAREAARMNLELSREAARVDAEVARETAQMKAEMSREEAEQMRQESTRLAQERKRERELQNAELAQTREELSRAHRELREATRVVARAHRDMVRADDVHKVSRHVNLGDRAVIGVVLGKESEQGVQLIGVSPDGPAERAGLEQGDILVSIRGVDLADNDEARQSVFQVMSDAGDGEEMAVVVNRDGESLEYTVTVEQREPRGWQSVIRIPEIEIIESVPGEQHIIVERIEVPEIDEVALAAQVAALTENLESHKFVYITSDGEHSEQHEFDFEEFSDFGKHAMSEANVWFGLPRAQGLELTSINEGLGAYFKTDRGVLVIKAREDNAYKLESGDVILSIDSSAVDSPSDMMRALRDVEPGSEIDIEIKRDRRDKTLSVVVPENRLGYR